MNDNERRSVIIPAISHKESRLAELDNERYNVLAELKSLKAEFIKLANHSPDVTSNANDSSHKNVSFVFKMVNCLNIALRPLLRCAIP
ncbi:MAG: hypothetical protein CV087_18230 [Candidatus Brocadia sp. WS118]|nr:MAG: hypothetical protein CV087_18230 [Candidatus Brocadia sp. WS118]